MKFEEFFQKYFKRKDGDFYAFSKAGFNLMRKSVDPFHDFTHIENLFSLLDEFLTKHKKVKEKVDLKALFLALCWHDAWKAEKDPKSVAAIIYNQAMEGLMSARMFKKAAKNYSIDPKTIARAAYAIRKHNSLQFLKRKTLEAKILRDIDKIDSVNFERFLYAKKKKFRFQKKLYLFLIHLYFSKISRTSYHFNWTKDLLMKERKEFLRRFNEEVR